MDNIMLKIEEKMDREIDKMLREERDFLFERKKIKQKKRIQRKKANKKNMMREERRNAKKRKKSSVKPIRKDFYEKKEILIIYEEYLNENF